MQRQFSSFFFYQTLSTFALSSLFLFLQQNKQQQKQRHAKKKKKEKEKEKEKRRWFTFFFFTSFVLRTFCYCYYYSRLSLTIKSRHFEAASTLSKKKSAFFPLTAGVFFFFLPHAFSEAPCGAVTVPLISLFPC